MLPSTLESPVRSAAARMPGMISMNTSESAFTALCSGFIRLFAFVFRSPRLMLSICRESARTWHTSLTRPAPKMICSWSPATKTPFQDPHPQSREYPLCRYPPAQGADGWRNARSRGYCFCRPLDGSALMLYSHSVFFFQHPFFRYLPFHSILYTYLHALCFRRGFCYSSPVTVMNKCCFICPCNYYYTGIYFILYRQMLSDHTDLLALGRER